jgi:hypothetical protein
LEFGIHLLLIWFQPIQQKLMATVMKKKKEFGIMKIMFIRLYQGESSTYSKRAEDTLILNSDWIKEEVQNWLVRELYESPKVYLEDENGNFEPVNITNASYKLKVNRRDGLIQEQVEISRTYVIIIHN